MTFHRVSLSVICFWTINDRVAGSPNDLIYTNSEASNFNATLWPTP